MVFESKDLGDVDTYTPTAADWKKIFDGHATVKWIVEGKNTKAPVTPGGKIGWYWSEARTLGGIKIAFIIDDTGSMTEEIGGVRTALAAYIDKIKATVPAGEDPPTIALTTFKDDVTRRIT